MFPFLMRIGSEYRQRGAIKTVQILGADELPTEAYSYTPQGGGEEATTEMGRFHRPARRRCSGMMQRFWMTSIPARASSAAAPSWRIPSRNHTPRGRRGRA